MRLLYEETASFAGGMNDSAAATAYQPNEAQFILNCRIAPDGTAQVRRGSRRLMLDSPGAGVGYGGVEFELTDGRPQLVIFVGERAFASDDDGATWAEIASGLPEAYWSLTTMRIRDKVNLIAANGGEHVYRWDGETWDTLPGAPAGVKYLATFNDRLYAAGHDGNMIVASKIRDPEEWTPPDGLEYQIGIHDGGGITGLAVAGAYLLIFKRDSVAWLDGFGNSDIIVGQGPRGVSQSIGCVAFRTIQSFGDRGVVWLSERCIHLYLNGEVHSITDRQLREFFGSGVNWELIDERPGVPVGAYHPALHEYWLALPSRDVQRPQNDTVIVANGVTGALTIWRNAGTSPALSPADVVDAQGFRIAALLPAYSFVEDDHGCIYFEGPFVGPDPEGLRIGDVVFPVEVYEAQVGHGGYAHAALFKAGRDRILSLGADGIVRHLDHGEWDDEWPDGSFGIPFAAEVLTRPMLFGQPFRRKRARVIDVLATADRDAEVEVSVVARGKDGAPRTLEFPAAEGKQPRRKRALVNGVGDTLQVRLRTTKAGLRIAGIRLAAEVLRQVA